MLKVYDSSWESPKGLDGYMDGSSKKDTLPETKNHQFAPEIRPKQPKKGRKFQLNQLNMFFQGQAVCFRKYICFFSSQEYVKSRGYVVGGPSVAWMSWNSMILCVTFYIFCIMATQKLLGGGFKDVLFSSWSLEKWSNLTSIVFRWVAQPPTRSPLKQTIHLFLVGDDFFVGLVLFKIDVCVSLTFFKHFLASKMLMAAEKTALSGSGGDSWKRSCRYSTHQSLSRCKTPPSTKTVRSWGSCGEKRRRGLPTKKNKEETKQPKNMGGRGTDVHVLLRWIYL